MEQTHLQHKHQIADFINDHLSPIKHQFTKIIQIENHKKWLPQHWALISSYSLSLLVHKHVDSMKPHFNLSNPNQLDHLLDYLMEDPQVSFLIQWLTKTQTYNDHNFKDRKNSFFRLLSKHLKKTLKGRISPLQSTKLKNLQESLNRNTISKRQIKDIELTWKDQISLYLNSQQLLADIITKNKSNASRYFYLLHLPEIKEYASQEILYDFPFYEKLDLKTSIKRMIGTLCGVLPLDKRSAMDELDSKDSLHSQRNNLLTNSNYETNFGQSYQKTSEEDIFSVLSLGIKLDPGQQPIGIKDNYLLSRLQNASENIQHSHASYK